MNTAPELDKKAIKRLGRIFGKDGFDVSQAELMFYEYDAGLDRGKPAAVVFPERTGQVVEVVRLAGELGLPLVARGAGTNLSGGSAPVAGGIVVALANMNRILHIDYESLRAVVQPGVVNLDLNNALADKGYFYAPDPASQKVSTLGGNVAENAGGPHCLKYGVTTNHVLALEVVMPDATVARLGGPGLDPPGYDMAGLFVGSEGTLGIVTEVTVRIMRKPEAVQTMLAVFDRLEDAADAVSAIIAAGIVPTTLEMMDQAAMGAVEESFQCGYPLDAAAVLIIEVDGLREGIARQADRIVDMCHRHRARQVHTAADAQEADRLWQGRRGVLSALARVSPNYVVCDGTVPRAALPAVLRQIVVLAQEQGFKVANVLHAGDGNLHPFISLRGPEQAQEAMHLAMDMLRVCAQAGGTITGEHGVGTEKRAAMSFVFSPDDIEAMAALRDVFDPQRIMNPRKIFADEAPDLR